MRRQASIPLTLIVLTILTWANVTEMSGRQMVRSTTGPLEIKLFIRFIIFLFGAVAWPSFAKAFTNNIDRRIGWWRLFEMYAITCLVITPHAVFDGWSLAHGGEVWPWTAMLDKAVQLTLFWLWTVKLTRAIITHPLPRRA